MVVPESNRGRRVEKQKDQAGRQQGDLSAGKTGPHASFLRSHRARNCSDCSKHTPITTTALTTSVYSTGTPRILIAVVKVWMINAPTSEPGRLKRPPLSD